MIQLALVMMLILVLKQTFEMIEYKKTKDKKTLRKATWSGMLVVYFALIIINNPYITLIYASILILIIKKIVL
ncbi:MAG: hypothetical protein IJ272_01800 [Clostridia bacterium]|nr:hypothetical protein [Clostridia bacterium]